MGNELEKIDAYLSASGGPFYELQKKVNLIKQDAFKAKERAIIFIAVTWGVPLLLTIFAGTAFAPYSESPYLLEPGIWARSFIAVGIFLMMERQVEEQLRKHLRLFFEVPLLAPSSFDAATDAITKALNRRESGLGEGICAAIALLFALATLTRFWGFDEPSWAVSISTESVTLTPAAWWVLLVSNPIFWFLLVRWLWRHHIWSMLLRDLAKLEFRLVATHPDCKGGLAFLGQYPNAFSSLVFAISCVLAAGLVEEFHTIGLTAVSYGYILAGWLILTFSFFAYPLFAFGKPLSDLKEKSLIEYGTLATRFHRARERDLIGQNIAASEDASSAVATEFIDPAKEYLAIHKMSVNLISRLGLLPVAASALIPLFIAGATQLPFQEVLKSLKRLLLF
jgi:hypothetical protein